MKNPLCKRRHRKAFTLVELLVVMGIIAILAGVIVASVGAALRFAKKTKASALAVQIQTAVENYYTEYGTYPANSSTPPTTDDVYDGSTTAGAAKWKDLTIALCGNIDPATGVAASTGDNGNTRGIAFLAPARSDLDTTFKAGSQYDTLKNPFAVDSAPFGTGNPAPYFYMVVDTDYSGIAGDTGSPPLLDFTGTTTANLGHGVPVGVAVWCSCDQVGTTGTKSSAWAHTY